MYIESLVDSIAQEMANQYDDMVREAFKRCGYDYEYVLKNPNEFFVHNVDCENGYVNTYILGNPYMENITPLFEIKRIYDEDNSKYRLECQFTKQVEVKGD